MPSLPMLFKGCEEESQPSSSVCEAPTHTRFVKQARTPFPLPIQLRPKPKYAPTTQYNFCVRGKTVSATKQISRMGKNGPLAAIQFPETFWP